MAGAGDLEETKIFKDITIGGAGKGRYAGKTDWDKYRNSPLWDKKEKKTSKKKEDTP